MEQTCNWGDYENPFPGIKMHLNGRNFDLCIMMPVSSAGLT